MENCVDLTKYHNCLESASPIRSVGRVTNVVGFVIEARGPVSCLGTVCDIYTTRRNKTIALSVTNPGPGIDPEHIDRIFDRFYRTDAARSRKSGSYGLGLAIAKEIIDQHKGRISAASEDSGRTTFYVELPLVAGE